MKSQPWVFTHHFPVLLVSNMIIPTFSDMVSLSMTKHDETMVFLSWFLCLTQIGVLHLTLEYAYSDFKCILLDVIMLLYDITMIIWRRFHSQEHQYFLVSFLEEAITVSTEIAVWYSQMLCMKSFLESPMKSQPAVLLPPPPPDFIVVCKNNIMNGLFEREEEGGGQGGGPVA